MNKREKMYEQIAKHGATIIDYFGLDDKPIALCKKLRRLEVKANKIMVDFCNGIIDSEELEAYLLKDLKPKLRKIFGESFKNIYINQDPRGYTLKLNEIVSKKIKGHKDLGGYFILAPDLSLN